MPDDVAEPAAVVIAERPARHHEHRHREAVRGDHPLDARLARAELRWMSGIATFTIIASRKIMNSPRPVATSVQAPRRVVGPLVTGKGYASPSCLINEGLSGEPSLVPAAAM